MKNLILSQQQTLQLSNPPQLSTLVEYQSYIAVYDNDVLAQIESVAESQTPKLRRLCKLSEHIPTLSLPILSLQYIPESHSTCLIDSAGNIILFSLDDQTIELVGELEGGVLSAKWSPDGEVLILITKQNRTVLAMHSGFEELFEETLEKELSPMVGGAQQPADVHDNPQITWRADGQFFAINSRDSKDGKNYIRVWSRDGDLISKSESKVEGLGSLLSYRPSGEIIASHQYLEGRNETRILFLEKNGLQHYDFVLSKGEKTNVHFLQWNSDSDLLCVHKSSPNDPDGHSQLQLWFRSNYHWYLKHQISFSTDNFPQMIWWEPEMSPFRLHVSAKSGLYHIYDFMWVHTTSPGTTEDNPMVVAVIDGAELKLTPMRYALVPPPMSTAKIVLENDPIIDVSMSANHLFVLGCSGQVHVFEFNKGQKRPPKFGLPPTKVGTFSVFGKHSDHGTGFVPRHLTAVSDTTVFLAMSNEGDPQEGGEYLRIFQKDGSQSTGSDLTNWIEKRSVVYNERILQIVHAEPSNRIYIETQSGEVHVQDFLGTVNHEHDISLPQPCPELSVCTFGEEEVLVGLTERGVLYFDNQVVASDCSSLAIHDAFLLFTTFSHYMRIIPRSRSLSDAVDIGSSLPGTNTYDETCRVVERGAVLVCAVPKDIRVVLQMPRGNLEGIYPRALVLSHVNYLLHREDYKLAFHNVRKYKIDMDFMIDQNPEKFETNVEKFIRALDNVNDVNLFLTNISNEIVTLSKYREYVNEDQHQNIVWSDKNQADINYSPPMDPNKVNRLVSLFRETLRRIDPHRYVTSILTTFAKSRPPQLEEALQEILSIRERESQGTEPEGSALEALKYLTFLVNVNDLYGIALGMYDFSLVIMVAQQSQKDPKEYLPFLADLQKQEQHLRRYNIDYSLGKYARALTHLAAKEDNEEYFNLALKLVKDENLYHDSFTLFKDETHLSQLLEAYAENLEDNMEYEQAALTYMKCKDKKEAALRCFRLSGNYHYAFVLAKKLNISEKDMNELAERLAMVCQEKGDFLGASQILCQYLQEYEEAVRMLCRSQNWSEALRICYLYGKQDLVDEVVEMNADEEVDTRIEELEEQHQKLEKYVNRLSKLRQERKEEEEERRRKLDEGFDEDGLGDIDALSETGSMKSGMTQSSTYSGVSVFSTYSGLNKTRVARSKKKRSKLRKGSPFEEENLVKRLETLVPSAYIVQEVSQLLKLLIFLGESKSAGRIQAALSSLIQYALDERTEIEQEFTQPEIEGEIAKRITPKKVLDILGVKTTTEAFSWKVNVL
uniref:Elongator complex protein 1 n=1 Tax=Percolomonas cosmopolitus TaxID=63605 RepID=A0A7S1PEA9_9EUKA|mmetsp:Transcript_11325/g.42457  ORF Transcript_11325/g.42457 Transcript_11325/m.42457 type:complete len:1287 (+) Transcript_11325:215-4075(+)|eukprot:CAMPEP_0117446998 /NCGR_PEP_ID=MMETSP0759-20121206/6640_1 /TAXON_ID=63605 /ORGANISM="Percolomonas cosmopolitus, Strain WS" /LENGTH=1286 /DNA_ID=CAMNT_0005239303 /DNA_START=138 /DNA_END=3998 /DNA_ORIENTATION=+